LSNKLWKFFSDKSTTIRAGARASPLSKKQVAEIEREIKRFYPTVRLDPVWTQTTGDKNSTQSLRDLEKTNFFTKEIDQLVLDGTCRIGVHSAKDLPDPLPQGLTLAAVTCGIDSSDALVLRPGESLQSLPPGATIATSSLRREEAARQLRKDFTFTDLRGTISERLARLDSGKVQGVIVAEAALIRLELTTLNRVKLPGETAKGQGQLAVVAREDDNSMHALFSVIDARPTCLYVGLHCPKDTPETKYLHYPVIKILPRPLHTTEMKHSLCKVLMATHCVFTSQSAALLFLDSLTQYGISLSSLASKTMISVGRKTAHTLEKFGLVPHIIPKNETAEGIIEALEEKDLEGAHIFWPRSSLSRSTLRDYFISRGIPLDDVVLYDTVSHQGAPLPSESLYESVMFTSPSTIDAFLDIFGAFPRGKTFFSIGPVTAKSLASHLKQLDSKYEDGLYSQAAIK